MRTLQSDVSHKTASGKQSASTVCLLRFKRTLEPLKSKLKSFGGGAVTLTVVAVTDLLRPSEESVNRSSGVDVVLAAVVVGGISSNQQIRARRDQAQQFLVVIGLLLILDAIAQIPIVVVIRKAQTNARL